MTNNLYTDLPDRLPEELFITLLEAENVRIKRIVSRGHPLVTSARKELRNGKVNDSGLS